jgi:hypothetical protein
LHYHSGMLLFLYFIFKNKKERNLSLGLILPSSNRLSSLLSFIWNTFQISFIPYTLAAYEKILLLIAHPNVKLCSRHFREELYKTFAS